MSIHFNETLAKSIFLLAGIPIKNLVKIENEYWPKTYLEAIATSPWFLVETSKGIIKIGWRKKVINIDWTGTGITINDSEDFLQQKLEKDRTTYWETGMHAWSYGKAVDYLNDFYFRAIPRWEYLYKEELLKEEKLGIER